MKFTSEDGRDWEEVTNITNTASDRKVIRPVKQEPKYKKVPQYHVNLWGGSQMIAIDYQDISEDQAQLIKECTEKMMEYLMGGAKFEDSYFAEVPILKEARQSMRENN